MLKLLLGDPNTRKLKRYQPIVEEINFLEEEISQFTDDELRKETQNLKSKISSELDFKKQKVLLEEFLPKAFAIVREAGKRVLDMRHFDVQLIAKFHLLKSLSLPLLVDSALTFVYSGLPTKVLA